MYPRPFRYHRAGSVEEAVSLLSELGEEAKVLAGGQSLIAGPGSSRRSMKSIH